MLFDCLLQLLQTPKQYDIMLKYYCDTVQVVHYQSRSITDYKLSC